jgi:restriction system protein
LRVLEDEKVHKSSDLPEKILAAGFFKLSEDELALEKSSGGSLFYDRVHWGVSYLYTAKFVVRPARGMVQISQKGLNFLAKNPSEMSFEFVKNDADFIARELHKSKKINLEVADTTDLSPTDLLEKGAKDLELTLKDELLEKLRDSNPYYFERIVLMLFKKMGYGDFRETSKSRDGGIDGIINQDQLGIEKIYVQAKRYANDNKVREPEIRNFIGAMSSDVMSKGIFVTTSFFDALAIKRAEDARN